MALRFCSKKVPLKFSIMLFSHVTFNTIAFNHVLRVVGKDDDSIFKNTMYLMSIYHEYLCQNKTCKDFTGSIRREFFYSHFI